MAYLFYIDIFLQKRCSEGRDIKNSICVTIQELLLKEILIIKFQLFLARHMNYLNLYSDEDKEQEKNLYHQHDSLSLTPSPQPNNSRLQFVHKTTLSGQIQNSEPASPVSKGARRGRKGGEELKNVNRGHWSVQQNKKYHWFLEIHYAHFVNRHLRRMDKIFKTMQIFIGTRQAEQCRSHHQKMQKKYLNFTTIISNLRKSHYGSVETEPVLQELNAFGLSTIDGLATIEYLMQQQSLNTIVGEFKQRKKSVSKTEKQAQLDEIKVQFNPELQNIQEQKIQDGYLKVNMLEQFDINIGEISLYHQKQENCGIFNSMFL